MLLRTLNEKGLEEFKNQLDELRIGTRHNLNKDFLTHSDFSIPFETEIDFEYKHFENKLELITYLCIKLQLRNNKNLYYDRGMWSWLAGFYFELLTTVSKEGSRKVNEDAKYILTEPKNWRKYYRHLLASFARIYCELEELSVPYLSYPISIWSDLHEQLFAYQQIATNKPLIAAANKLYWDEKNQKIKRGAGSSGPGTPRRFSAVVGQFEMTFDLNAMNDENILSLFPMQEFKKWESVA
jgi:hypothetical protein